MDKTDLRGSTAGMSARRTVEGEEMDQGASLPVTNPFRSIGEIGIANRFWKTGDASPSR
jgi:hypothetical protein